MAPDAESLTALAVLMRSIVAMLSARQTNDTLVRWGEALHGRFAFPFYLKQDLREVLSDLERCGFGLGQPIVDILLNDSHRLFGVCELDECKLVIKQALEFWPLMGDSASQEGGTARWVDASTARLQFTLHPAADGESTLNHWRVAVNGWQIPLMAERHEHRDLLMFGIRFRAFVPWHGLHPALTANDPLELVLWHSGKTLAHRVRVHQWKPDGGRYDGLPADEEEARCRRSERLTLETVSLDDLPQFRTVPATAVRAQWIDLRRL